MTDGTATHRIDARAAPSWFLFGLIVLAGALAYIALWRWATLAGSFFGGDLVAYTNAADRLAATGSPYHPALLLGPTENRIENVPIGYFYPPVLAQLFLPLRAVPHLALGVAWSGAQATCLAILLPLAYAGRAALTMDRALIAIGFGLAFYPLQVAVYGGNVSGWLAIGVALSLASGPRTRGLVAALGTVVKLTPLPMLVAALTDRRSRLVAAIPLAVIVMVSVLVAPRAWSDFVTILPNVLRNGMADSPTNLSPANALVGFGLLGMGVLVGWALAFGLGIAALITGIREGYSDRVMARAVLSLTFASSTQWDHYLGVMVPLILWAWPEAGTRRRSAIAVFVALATGLWLRFNEVAVYRLALVAALVVCTLAIATIPERAAGGRVAWASGT